MRTLANPEDTNEVLSRLRRVQPGKKALWGRMTAPQMICHLTDSFRLVLGERQVSSATGVFQRTVVKWLALRAPFKWPHGLPTRPEVDQFAGGTPPGNFEADRSALIEAIKRFSTNPDGCAAASHPFFGKMPPKDWMRWGYLHTDHHLRQFGE